MPKVIQIPRVGNVQFPDDMSDEEISKVAGAQHDRKVIGRVLKFVNQELSFGGMNHSDWHKEMASISALLEKHPTLATAMYEGIGKMNSELARQRKGV